MAMTWTFRRGFFVKVFFVGKGFVDGLVWDVLSADFEGTEVTMVFRRIRSFYN